MVVLILCYIFSSTLNWGSTVIDVIMWFNNHPFLAILVIEEILFGTTVKVKIFK